MRHRFLGIVSYPTFDRVGRTYLRRVNVAEDIDGNIIALGSGDEIMFDDDEYKTMEDILMCSYACGIFTSQHEHI